MAGTVEQEISEIETRLADIARLQAFYSELINSASVSQRELLYAQEVFERRLLWLIRKSRNEISS